MTKEFAHVKLDSLRGREKKEKYKVPVFTEHL
jgi:hypothetical protein